MSGEYFSLKYHRNNLSHFRCAVVVPTSFSKSAVDRNRIRRFFYDAIARHLPTHIPVDLVFYVKKTSIPKMLSEIDNTIALSARFFSQD